MEKLNNRRISLVNSVQQRLQEKIPGISSLKSPAASQKGSSPRRESHVNVEDVIPPYAPNDDETTGKMISPPEEPTLIPTAEFFWLLQSFDASSKEACFSNLFEFPSQSRLYWRLRISSHVDSRGDTSPATDDDGSCTLDVTLQPASVPNFTMNVVCDFETFVSGHCESNLSAKKTTLCSFEPSSYASQLVGSLKSRLFSQEAAVTIRCLLKPAMAEDDFFDAYDCL